MQAALLSLTVRAARPRKTPITWRLWRHKRWKHSCWCGQRSQHRVQQNVPQMSDFIVYSFISASSNESSAAIEIGSKSDRCHVGHRGTRVQLTSRSFDLMTFSFSRAQMFMQKRAFYYKGEFVFSITLFRRTLSWSCFHFLPKIGFCRLLCRV